jgi:curli biogenesis system outer membrane secretion channel CsgG
MKSWRFLLSEVAAGSVGLIAAGCVTLPVLPARPLPPNAIPPVVAVSSFDDRSGFQGGWKLGAGMADMLTAELVKSRNFVIVERGELDKVTGEIDRQKDRRFRAEGRVSDGRLKNAQYLVRGVVNDFSQVGEASFFVALVKYMVGAKGGRARVALTLTIVNVETGEIADSVYCAGTALARKAYGEGDYRGMEFGGKVFLNTPLGTATTRAIRKGVRAIVKKVPRTYWEPMIAEVSDGRVVVNGGSDRGMTVGAEYVVRGAGRQITDPVTGDVLSVVAGPVLGTLRIVEVLDKVSYAQAIRGGGFQRGQRMVPVEPAPR